MNFNKNLLFLNQKFNEGRRGVILEGASRSGKTFAGIDFIILIDHLCPKSEIIIVRETYNSFKTTLYNDFNRRFPQWELKSPFESVNDKSVFWLPKGSKVSLMGADTPNKFHGAGSDFFFINEAIDVPQSIFDQLEQRCRRFWWLDYNPKVTDHWIYDKVCNRPDVSLLRTSFLDNPYITSTERAKILSYEPTDANQKAGTVDPYMWKVYGLGERAAMEGLIFGDVTWIDHFPDDCEIITHGLDFGYTQDPAAMVKVGRNGMNLFIKKLVYTPIDNPDTLSQVIKAHLKPEDHIYCDSADPGMVSALRQRGIKALLAKKYPNSIQDGIAQLKRFRLHLVRDPDMRKEQENYKWRYINGIALNVPEDKFNHIWDAVRYAIQVEFRI